MACTNHTHAHGVSGACILKHFRYVGVPDHHEGMIDTFTSWLAIRRSMHPCVKISKLYGRIIVASGIFEQKYLNLESLHVSMRLYVFLFIF